MHYFKDLSDEKKPNKSKHLEISETGHPDFGQMIALNHRPHK